MKKKDRYKIINYAVGEYSRIFDEMLAPVTLTQKLIDELLSEYEANSICEWYYCCEGWQYNCWQEPYEEGNWGMTQADVEMQIKMTVKSCAEACRRDRRAYICRGDDQVRLYIIMRDIDCKCDYLMSFYNEDREEKSA